MGHRIDSEINERWRDLRPRVLKLAKQEVDDCMIQHLLTDLPEELPESTCIHIYMSSITKPLSCVYVCVALYTSVN